MLKQDPRPGYIPRQQNSMRITPILKSHTEIITRPQCHTPHIVSPISPLRFNTTTINEQSQPLSFQLTLAYQTYIPKAVLLVVNLIQFYNYVVFIPIYIINHFSTTHSDLLMQDVPLSLIIPRAFPITFSRSFCQIRCKQKAGAFMAPAFKPIQLYLNNLFRVHDMLFQDILQRQTRSHHTIDSLRHILTSSGKP